MTRFGLASFPIPLTVQKLTWDWAEESELSSWGRRTLILHLFFSSASPGTHSVIYIQRTDAESIQTVIRLGWVGPSTSRLAPLEHLGQGRHDWREVKILEGLSGFLLVVRVTLLKLLWGKESWRAFPMLHPARDPVLARGLSKTRTNEQRSPLTGNCHISTNHLSSWADSEASNHNPSAP